MLVSLHGDDIRGWASMDIKGNIGAGTWFQEDSRLRLASATEISATDTLRRGNGWSSSSSHIPLVGVQQVCLTGGHLR